MDGNLPKPRRWFRFSLRTMFVLIVLLSIPLNWVGYQIFNGCTHGKSHIAAFIIYTKVDS